MAVTAPWKRRNTESLGESLETLGHRGRGSPCSQRDAALSRGASLLASNVQQWNQRMAGDPWALRQTLPMVTDAALFGAFPLSDRNTPRDESRPRHTAGLSRFESSARKDASTLQDR